MEASPTLRLLPSTQSETISWEGRSEDDSFHLRVSETPETRQIVGVKMLKMEAGGTPRKCT